MTRIAAAFVAALSLAPAGAHAGRLGVSGELGYWRARNSDPDVATIFGGAPSAVTVGVALEAPLRRRMALMVSVDAFQGSTERAFRQTGTGPLVVVDEQVWLRMVDLLAGPRFDGGGGGNPRFHTALLGGATVVDQR